MTSTATPSELAAHLGFWLRMVSNSVSQAFAAKLAAEDVTVAEWVVMRTLYGNDPTPPSALAEKIGMTRGAITKLADRLIGKSLVVRKASNADGRAQTLALTAQGKRLVPNLAALADRNDAEFFASLTPREHRMLEALLKKVVAHHRMTSLPTS